MVVSTLSVLTQRSKLAVIVYICKEGDYEIPSGAICHN